MKCPQCHWWLLSLEWDSTVVMTVVAFDRSIANFQAFHFNWTIPTWGVLLHSMIIISLPPFLNFFPVSLPAPLLPPLALSFHILTSLYLFLRLSLLFSSCHLISLSLISTVSQVKPFSQRQNKPLLVFINPKSGSNQGDKLMQIFQWLLNPRQVFNLTKDEPKFGWEMEKLLII